MDMFESKMINLLCDLKENYHVCSIKSEFETLFSYNDIVEERIVKLICPLLI